MKWNERANWRRLAGARLRLYRETGTLGYQPRPDGKNSPASTTTAVITLHLLVVTDEELGAIGVPVATTFRYDAADPWAVQMTFEIGEEEDHVKWRLARSVLADGLKGESGNGDVRICPVSKRDLTITLSNSDRAALLSAPARQVGAFLRSTYQIVPKDAEPSCVDIDAELSSLLEDPR